MHGTRAHPTASYSQLLQHVLTVRCTVQVEERRNPALQGKPLAVTQK